MATEKKKGFPWFWILLVLAVVAAGAWYWWKQKPTTQDKTQDDEKTKPNPPIDTSGGGGGGSALSEMDACGGLEGITKKFVEDSFFRNQRMGIAYRGKNKCQVIFLQTVLNAKEKAGLAVDGDFGPATLAAVRKAFGKDELNLNDLDFKYKITNNFKNPIDILFSFSKNTK